MPFLWTPEPAEPLFEGDYTPGKDELICRIGTQNLHRHNPLQF